MICTQQRKRPWLLLCLSNLLVHSSHGFLPSLALRGNLARITIRIDDTHPPRLYFHPRLVSISSCILLARPPPKAMFDLEEIERREKEWDDQLKKSTSEDDDDDISDESYEDEFLDSPTTLYEFHVSEKLHDARIDAILAEFMPELSRSQCATLVDDGCVSILLDGTSENTTRIDRKSTRVERGNTIQVVYTERSTSVDIKAQDIPLDILYEDECMIVINKQAGMVVHPAVGNWVSKVI